MLDSCVQSCTDLYNSVQRGLFYRCWKVREILRMLHAVFEPEVKRGSVRFKVESIIMCSLATESFPFHWSSSTSIPTHDLELNGRFMLLSPVPYKVVRLFSIPPQQPLFQHHLFQQRGIAIAYVISHWKSSNHVIRSPSSQATSYILLCKWNGHITSTCRSYSTYFLNYIGMLVTETMTWRFPASLYVKHCTGYMQDKPLSNFLPSITRLVNKHCKTTNIPRWIESSI